LASQIIVEGNKTVDDSFTIIAVDDFLFTRDLTNCSAYHSSGVNRNSHEKMKHHRINFVRFAIKDGFHYEQSSTNCSFTDDDCGWKNADGYSLQWIRTAPEGEPYCPLDDHTGGE